MRQSTDGRHIRKRKRRSQPITLIGRPGPGYPERLNREITGSTETRCPRFHPRVCTYAVRRDQPVGNEPCKCDANMAEIAPIATDNFRMRVLSSASARAVRAFSGSACRTCIIGAWGDEFRNIILVYQ
jgi:hypothetical protein